MTHRFLEIATTPAVRAAQEAQGSRRAYARQEEGPAHHDRLGGSEAAFIAARDSFYMASVSETGWPYLQHRGGPRGFLRVLDETTLGFADLRGNRQYLSLGNLSADDRLCLFLMDYANQARLKIFGRARFHDLAAEPELARRLVVPARQAWLERVCAASAVSLYYAFRLPQLFGFNPLHNNGTLVDLSGLLPTWSMAALNVATTAFFFAWLVGRGVPTRSWSVRPPMAARQP